MFLKLREPINGYTHFVAAVLAVIGCVFLLVSSRNDPAKEISLCIYGLSLVFLFAASTAYHGVHAKPKILENLRKLDHAAIYLLIAGTYTPFCTIVFQGFWRWGMMAVIWSLAGTGILIKMFLLHAPRWLSAGIYLAMGWLSLTAIGEMWRTLTAGALIWLMIGGLIYTAGALVYITKRMDFLPGVFGFHEVWHLFVIFGSFAHFIAIAVYLTPTT